MEVICKKYINTEKDNRVEFLLVNYDYFDGNDYIARLFIEKYNFVIEKKIDGWWYSIIRISDGYSEYELLWHEDIGNEIYSLKQTKEENEVLLQRLEKVLCILNDQIKDN